MDKKQFTEKIKEIGTCEDTSQIRTMLAELQEDVSSVFDNCDTLTKDNADLKEDVSRLQADNMKLFLMVGDDDKKLDDEPEPEPQKRKFEDLFNDKGGIK